MGLGKSYFFIGIGGSGMMPLAMILAGRGAAVAGSDRSLDQGRVPAKFAALEALGIALHPQDGSGINSSEQIVIASAAIEPTVPDRVAAERVGARLLSRAELLSQLFNDSRVRVGVAGTSGKSTVTGMIAWILHATGHEPTVMNGAVMKNFATPDAPFASALVGGGDVFVSEVDESDGSIALYHPTIAVLNNVSHDHKSMAELRVLFGDFLARAGDAGGTTIVNADDAEALALHTARAPDYAGSFSIGGTPTPLNFVADNIVEEPFAISFDLIDATMPVGRVRLKVPGRHNVANALAALMAACAAGVALPDAMAAIGGFAGLKRRFDLIGEAGGVAVIDDFGHNPDKIGATLDTLHAFPGRLLILFQPHGYGPLKMMRDELVDSLAARLAPGDLLILPDPVYQGGTVTREVTSADIVADLAARGAPARYIADRADAAALLVREAQPGDRIIVMGARDDTLSQLAADMLAALAARPLSDTPIANP